MQHTKRRKTLPRVGTPTRESFPAKCNEGRENQFPVLPLFGRVAQSTPVLLTQTHKHSGRPSGTLSAKAVSAVDAAIAKSQDYLLGVQKPEGYWVGELM